MRTSTEASGVRALSARSLAQFERWDGVAAAPRDAATVLVTRASEDGVEALLLRRPASMQFAAGMHVFPGGAVHDGDRAPTPWLGPDAEAWAARWGCSPELARMLVVAAVRETFEETGILFAGPDERSLVGVCADTEAATARRALESGAMSLGHYLIGRGLFLRADLLGAWAHWITPQFEPRRYDTRFFVATLPPDQPAVVPAAEAEAAFWMECGAAVRAAQAGTLAMMTPTVRNLQALSRTGSAGLAAAVAGTADRRIPVVEPRVVEADGRFWITADGADAE